MRTIPCPLNWARYKELIVDAGCMKLVRTVDVIMIKTIYLCHHSHTDIGFTHDQPIVKQLHQRFISQALDLADIHRDRGPATFRWTCEVTSMLMEWLKSATPNQRDRFVAAADRGQMEVCALSHNLTPLSSLERLVDGLSPVRWLREKLGLSIRVAMNSDVNGQSWGLPDLLMDAGIEGLTMSINEHFGGAPSPRPGALRWQTPTGRELLVWNGPTYAHPAWIEMGGDMDTARRNVDAMVAGLDQDEYPLPFLYMQITHPGPQNDNMGPVAFVSDWIEKFNATSSGARLCLTTPSAFFDVLKKAPEFNPPTVSGDWTDWWNFGAASTPMETAIGIANQHRLRNADLLAMACPEARQKLLRDQAAAAIDLWNEHTWGADISVGQPNDPDTRAQACFKNVNAYEGRALTTMLCRDGLSALVRRIGGAAAPGIVVFNPTTQTQTQRLQVARRILFAQNVPNNPLPEAAEESIGWPADFAYQHLLDRSAWQRTDLLDLGTVTVPPLSWKVISADEHKAEQTAFQATDDKTLSKGDLALTPGPGPGLQSLKHGGREWVRQGPMPFGSLVYESIDGPRGSIMELPEPSPSRGRRANWHGNVPIHRTLPELDGYKREPLDADALGFSEQYQLPTCRGVRQHWRLNAASDACELTIEIDKLPTVDPHGLYVSLPFNLDDPQALIQVAGAVVDPTTEQIKGASPWWSLQGGFCMGDHMGTVYVATIDTPLLQLNRFRIGASHVNGKPVNDPGLALPWVYNNLWETNFAADSSGLFRFRFVMYFTDSPPDRATLASFVDRCSRPLLYHPLFAGSLKSKGSWPATGQLLDVETGPAQLVAVLPADDASSARWVINNPTDAAAPFSARSAQLNLRAARYCDPTGKLGEPIECANGQFEIKLPARATRIIHLTLETEDEMDARC